MQLGFYGSGPTSQPHSRPKSIQPSRPLPQARATRRNTLLQPQPPIAFEKCSYLSQHSLSSQVHLQPGHLRSQAHAGPAPFQSEEVSPAPIVISGHSKPSGEPSQLQLMPPQARQSRRPLQSSTRSTQPPIATHRTPHSCTPDAAPLASQWLASIYVFTFFS